MRKLALPEEVLLQIEQPARYIGNEFNSVVKDKEKVALRGAFLFPDVYEIGMSHLGIQILYDMFNKREDMWCERVYSPWPDLDRVMREQNIPLFGLESQESVKNEDFLFITLQYEMCYTNVLQRSTLPESRCMRWSVPARTRSSSAAARVRTTRSRSLRSSTCFTSERVRLCTTSFSTRIWKIKRTAEPVWIF